MSEGKLFILAHDEARTRARAFVSLAPAGWRVECKPPKRNAEQNAKFHAICSDLQYSGRPWAGKPRSAAQWKVLLVSAHAKATKEEFDIVPGLEGEFVNLRESTALMSVKRSSSLIEYAVAFMAMQGVEA
jgi:hypothetical protein